MPHMVERQTLSDQSKHSRPRPRAVTLLIGAFDAFCGLIVAWWIAKRFSLSLSLGGTLTFCVVWIVLYPVARRNRSVPAWAHWANGGFILIVLWLTMRWYR